MREVNRLKKSPKVPSKYIELIESAVDGLPREDSAKSFIVKSAKASDRTDCVKYEPGFTGGPEAFHNVLRAKGFDVESPDAEVSLRLSKMRNDRVALVSLSGEEPVPLIPFVRAKEKKDSKRKNLAKNAERRCREILSEGSSEDDSRIFAEKKLSDEDRQEVEILGQILAKATQDNLPESQWDPKTPPKKNGVESKSDVSGWLGGRRIGLSLKLAKEVCLVSFGHGTDPQNNRLHLLRDALTQAGFTPESHPSVFDIIGQIKLFTNFESTFSADAEKTVRDSFTKFDLQDLEMADEVTSCIKEKMAEEEASNLKNQTTGLIESTQEKWRSVFGDLAETDPDKLRDFLYMCVSGSNTFEPGDPQFATHVVTAAGKFYTSEEYVEKILQVFKVRAQPVRARRGGGSLIRKKEAQDIRGLAERDRQAAVEMATRIVRTYELKLKIYDEGKDLKK